MLVLFSNIGLNNNSFRIIVGQKTAFYKQYQLDKIEKTSNQTRKIHNKQKTIKSPQHNDYNLIFWQNFNVGH